MKKLAETRVESHGRELSCHGFRGWREHAHSRHFAVSPTTAIPENPSSRRGNWTVVAGFAMRFATSGVWQLTSFWGNSRSVTHLALVACDSEPAHQNLEGSAVERVAVEEDVLRAMPDGERRSIAQGIPRARHPAALEHGESFAYRKALEQKRGVRHQQRPKRARMTMPWTSATLSGRLEW